MPNTTRFSRKQLFNIALKIADTSLLNFSKSINSTPPLVHSCLNEIWHNKKIDDAIDSFIGLQVSYFDAWDRKIGKRKKSLKK